MGSKEGNHPVLRGFRRLPPELRFMVYGHTFEDAFAECMLPTTKGSSPSFRVSQHWSIMATCKLYHAEAVELYWKSVRLYASRNGQPGYELSQLLGGLPQHVRGNLRHLRNVQIAQRPSNETRIDQNAADLLRQLPKLETCELCVIPIERPRDIVKELDSPKFPANMTQEGNLISEFPDWFKAYAAGQEETAVRSKVEFLLKFGGPPLCRHSPDSWDLRSAYHPIQAAYINISTRRFFAVSWLDDSNLGDEYGFRQVLR